MGGIESFTGVGLIFGPVVSAMIYAKFDYSMTFTLYGVFLILFSFIIKAYFPNTSNRTAEILSKTSLDELEENMI